MFQSYRPLAAQIVSTDGTDENIRGSFYQVSSVGVGKAVVTHSSILAEYARRSLPAAL